MNWKGYVFIILTSICYVLIGICIGRESSIEKNNQLYKEYEELRSKYNDLEADLRSQYYNENIELEWKLDSCYQQLGDLEDNPYDLNRDGNINALDYIKAEKIKQEIKKIMMER